MITRIIKEQDVIDWEEPMLVQNDKGIIILTTGNHTVDTFAGVVLTIEPGTYGNSWIKREFTPITDCVTIEFNPYE